MDVLEDEWYAVRHSGEIPEVALHAALYYLCDDADGPGLTLSPEQKKMLVEAAEMRFREIVLRDMQQASRGKPEYRGVKRSLVNWRRYRVFCSRQQLDAGGFRPEVAGTLLRFIREEVANVDRKRQLPPINCSFDELNGFAAELGLPETMLPGSVRRICCPPIHSVPAALSKESGTGF